jgi:uncharacterized small protein (DUF1192 family)
MTDFESVKLAKEVKGYIIELIEKYEALKEENEKLKAEIKKKTKCPYVLP